MGGSVEDFSSLEVKIRSIINYRIGLEYSFAIGEVGITIQYVVDELQPQLPRVVIELQYRNRTITAPLPFERAIGKNVSKLCIRLLELLLEQGF